MKKKTNEELIWIQILPEEHVVEPVVVVDEHVERILVDVSTPAIQ